MEANSKRGRPLGSGKDDADDLKAVAALILATPGLLPTTAYKRLKASAGDADIRRFQVKWKANAGDLMAQAQARREMQTQARQSEGSRRARHGGVAASLAEIAHTISALSANPAMQSISDIYNSPGMQAMRDLHSSPAMQAVRDLHDSPAMRAVRDLQNSPAMQAIRDIQDSPTMRAIREYQDSPVMRAVREQQEIISRMRGY